MLHLINILFINACLVIRIKIEIMDFWICIRLDVTNNVKYFVSVFFT